MQRAYTATSSIVDNSNSRKLKLGRFRPLQAGGGKCYEKVRGDKTDRPEVQISRYARRAVVLRPRSRPGPWLCRG